MSRAKYHTLRLLLLSCYSSHTTLTDSVYDVYCKPLFIKLHIPTVVISYIFDIKFYALKNSTNFYFE